MSQAWVTGSHLSKSQEINILMVVHDIRMFVAIEIHALWCLSPLEVEFQHPLTGSIKSDWFEYMIIFCHLGLLYKSNNGLGRNVYANISNMNQ